MVKFLYLHFFEVPLFTSLNLFDLIECLINAHNKILTSKTSPTGFFKTFSKFYGRHCELVSKFKVGLKPLLHQSRSESNFYGDLVYKFKTILT